LQPIQLSLRHPLKSVQFKNMTQAEFKKPRIELIDILRGLTLLGIIMVHFIEQYYAGMPPQKASHLNSAFLPDQLIQTLVSVLIAGKFYMIFSFLFGLSFFFQSSAKENKRQFYLQFFWRLLVLFGIGWIHHMHYRGDILTIYALLGMVLLAVHKLPDKLILLLAILLIADLPAFITRGIEVFNTSQTITDGNPFEGNDIENSAYYDTLKGNSYLSILKANIPEFLIKMKFQVLSGRLYITMGLFLLGLYVGRKRVFENIELLLPFIRSTRNKALWCMLILFVIAAAFFGIAHLLNVELSFQIQFMVGGFLVDLFNACLALFYVCIALLLYQKKNWRNRLANFYHIGRMGLTTYLMQTLFGFILFFGVGFNLLDTIGASACFFIGISIFGFQIIFANWWLSKFYYGPVEWLWRSLTYLKVQPFKR
jgi:uncharacterized protein